MYRYDVFRRWGRGVMRVITVGIGCVVLASATSRFSGYMKVANAVLHKENQKTNLAT